MVLGAQMFDPFGLNRNPLESLTVWLKQALAGLKFRSDFDSVAWSQNHRQNVSKTRCFLYFLVICRVGYMIL